MSVELGKDIVVELLRHAHAIGKAARPRLVAPERRQPRALAGDAIENLLGAGEMFGRRGAEEAIGVDGDYQLAAQG